MNKVIQALRIKWHQQLEALIFRLSRPDALMHMAFFGIITGFLAGGVIVLFRLLVEHAQEYMLPGDSPENYEALSPVLHFLLPITSSILLAILFYKWSKGIRVLGVARIMERVAFYQGYLTIRGFFMQFIGAAIAIIGGHSVGREGPHAYLGASISSLFGQMIKLPNNSIRTLVACGSAAGIAASFNTPLAGVIFSLEVIMMEYALNSFIPVMLAAVVATALSNAVMGSEPAFVIADFHSIPMEHLPVVLVLGFVVGTCAALFNHLMMLISSKTRKFDIWWRILVSGFAIGSLALIQPEILGIGYDSVNASLAGEYALGMLLLLAFLKIFATSLSIGLGVPGGMIGPAFFIGSTMGGAVWLMATWIYADPTITPKDYIGSYALLGMGAMMGASLQAPLAALTAIMELTYSPGIIMPAMLAIVVAQLTASELFNKKSLFVSALRANGLDLSINPVLQVLRGLGVAVVLDKKFERHPSVITRETAELIIHANQNWIIINDEDDLVHSLMPISELAKYLAVDHLSDDKKKKEEGNEVNLMGIPAQRLSLSPISLQSNLMQAHNYLGKGAESLFVVFRENKVDKNSRIYGVITQKEVEKAYIPTSN